MIPYPNINPVAIQLGPLSVRWYGLMYIIGFTVAYFVLKARMKETGLVLRGTEAGDAVVFHVFGLLIGARVGYCLFYNPVYYLTHPFEMMQFWAGGLSFHGGLIGALIAGYFFCKKRGIDLYTFADTNVVSGPIGLGLGRLGNFINGELYGRPTDVPWAMVFPGDPKQLPRHPSQLYEFALEGLLLAAILWGLRNVPMPRGTLFWIFIAGYGLFRTFGELFREPDAHLSFILPNVTAGMIISLPMLVVGAAMVYLRLKSGEAAER